MSWTLLTNDDGVDSPALPPFARALAAGREVRTVAPDRERSWIGKAITRFEPVSAEPVERDGRTIWACSGYPADAVQLGVHALFDDTAPELVVSGVNLGFNHGAAFLMSSGTVGAAIEGWVSGIPAIAFSTGANRSYADWRAHARSEEAVDDWVRLSEVCTVLLDEVTSAGLLDLADVVTVNVPFDADHSTPRRVTRVARVGYDALFRGDGQGGFVHDFGGTFRHFEALEGTDVDAAQHGWISITPLRMPEAADVPDHVRAALER